jgi:cohesin loading factor subunit SCC2
MILLALWEVRTYLRRLYSMGTTSRRGETKAGGKLQTKDLIKAPVKVQGITGDKVWEELATIMTALTDRGRMTATCKAFVELMNVDKEFLVPAEEDEELDMDGDREDGMGLGSGGEDDGEELQQQQPSRGRKRKSQGGGGPGPKKKRARSSSQQPRKKGRPRKQSVEAQLQDADGEADWF